MKNTIAILNQLFEMQQKLIQDNQYAKYERNFNRLFASIEESGFIHKNPLGEKYTEARTDCEANIVGKESASMVITQVIKPIVYAQQNGALSLVQKGIVMVESK